MSSDASPRDGAEAIVLALLAEQLAVPPGPADREVPFLELGVNSLMLMEISRAIERRFGMRIPVSKFFTEVPCVAALAEYVAQVAPATQTGTTAAPAAAALPAPVASATWLPTPLPAAPAAPGADAVPGAGWDDLFARQLRSVSDALNQVVAQQLAMLAGAAPAAQAQAHAPAGAPAQVPAAAQAAQPHPAAAGTGPAPQPLPPFRPTELKARGMSSQQRWHLGDLARRYNGRTARSKSLTQQYRHVLADNRASAGFRFSTKELTYPLVGTTAAGSRFRDLDGNEYVDLTMGFGVNLFGHQPDFVKAAMARQLELGIQVGPQSALAGETAALFSELTGMPRVAFCNTGTEAVMAALRLARAVTGRRRVAMFEGSYHGQFDGTLGVRAEAGQFRARPIAPGIPLAFVDDLLLLDYADPASLELVRAHRHELAAVLVEPVQSRRPELQPREFLQALRALTREAGIVLIFDEMITGLRLGQRGAQGFYGVEADLATYGKVLGGGMPVGAVAGRAELLDAFDGGFWRYGDDSFPGAETTFFAGTFNKHPLTMAAAHAVLRHLLQAGPSLQEGLNARCDAFFRRLDATLKAEGAPLSLAWCGSQFRFRAHGNAELFFHHLPEKGVFIWEGRNCFVSTAHTEADLERVEAAAVAALEEMRGGGFLAQPKDAPARAMRVPLTTAQRQLVLQAELDEAGSRAYHVSMLLELQGPLDERLLQSGLDALVARHDVLRAHVAGPTLRLAATGSCALETARVAPQEYQACAQEVVDRPFDLARGPLLRAHLADLGGECRQLLLVAHHVVADGWSMGVLAHELGQWLRTGGQPGWDAAPSWVEIARLSDADGHGERAAHREHWRAAFADGVPRLALPTDGARATAQRFAGARRVGLLPAALADGVAAFARAQGMTEFVPLLAAWAAVLAQESPQERLLIGIPVAGRSQPVAATAVGYLAHLLPLQIEVLAHDSFASLAQRVKEAWLQASAHEDYPYAQLLEDLDDLLARERDRTRAPLVETVFNLDRAGMAPDYGPGLRVGVGSPPVRHVAYELALNLVEVPGQPGLALEADFNPELYAADGMAARLERYQALLARAVAEPRRPLGELLAAPAQALPALLALGCNPAEPDADAPACAWRLFARSAEDRPEAPAVVDGARRLSYAQLSALAQGLAAALAAQGVGAGQRVGIALPRSAEAVAAVLAVLRLGAAYVPLDPEAPPARLQHQARDAALAAVLATSALALPCPVLAPQPLHAALPPLAEPDPQAVAYVLYTSGSTGTPKGALITHAGLVHLARAQARAFALEPGSRCLQSVALTFDVASGEIFSAFAAGACLVLSPSTLPGAQLLQLLHEQAITHWQVPVAVLAALPPEAAASLAQLRCLTVGGEPLPPALARLWAPGRQLFNAYGPTETTVCASVARIDAQALQHARLPIGRPLGAARLYVVDAQGRLCPQGVPGELWIGGPGVALQYLQRPQLSAEKFGPDPFVPGARIYRSGDRVRWRADGQLDFLGRMDQQLKLRGMRIEPGEIAQALAAHPQVREAAVVLRHDGAEPRLAAYYSGQPCDPGELKAFLRARLPEALVPSFCQHLAALPLSRSGKVDTRALQALDAPAQLQAATPAQAPRTPMEQRVAEVFRQVLGLAADAPLDRHANFFDLGGHSLLATRLSGRLGMALGREAPLALVFSHPTVAALAEALEAAPDPALAPTPAVAAIPRRARKER